jgi:hypothetical protein
MGRKQKLHWITNWKNSKTTMNYKWEEFKNYNERQKGRIQKLQW